MLIAALFIFIIAGLILLVWAWITALKQSKPSTDEFWTWGSNASWEVDCEDDNHTERDAIV
jgi:hypothetical protein